MTYDEIGFFVFGNVKKYKKHRIFMNEQKRLRNEKEYDKWIEQPNGGRIYSFEIVGRFGWVSKYLKETNAEETTVKFWQEIYDEVGNLKEIHEKYPVDKGHQKYNL